MKTLTKTNGIAIAKIFREALLDSGYPVLRVIVYGSVARDEALEDSDLDIAVVCEPFAATRHDENMVFRRLRRTIDHRIEPFTLHPDDFGKPYFALPYAVEQEGVEV
ncbi:MAG: nucleotidyltransferase domain-containing protein [Candidatus Peregrinibacteria bacterium]|nr:nucleotidyltransferase domain-containing protein [Candidatus Peregrinibacteria bacterium]